MDLKRLPKVGERIIGSWKVKEIKRKSYLLKEGLTKAAAEISGSPDSGGPEIFAAAFGEPI